MKIEKLKLNTAYNLKIDFELLTYDGIRLNFMYERKVFFEDIAREDKYQGQLDNMLNIEKILLFFLLINCIDFNSVIYCYSRNLRRQYVYVEERR